MPFFLTPSYADGILRSALRGRVACCLCAGSTKNKTLVPTEGDLRTCILNLPMIKLSHREEMGSIGVILGIMKDYNLYLLNLRLWLFFLYTAMPC